VAVAVGFGGFDQPLYFPLGQVLARAQFRIRAPAWRNCSIYGGWAHRPQY
jgi:hypothetical protein